MHIEDIRKLKSWMKDEGYGVPDNKWIGKIAGKFDECACAVFAKFEDNELTLTKTSGRLDKIQKGRVVSLLNKSEAVISAKKLEDVIEKLAHKPSSPCVVDHTTTFRPLKPLNKSELDKIMENMKWIDEIKKISKEPYELINEKTLIKEPEFKFKGIPKRVRFDKRDVEE